MQKRNYTNIKRHESEIIAMREKGMTRQQIADALSLTKQQIKNWIFRYNKRNQTQKGRP